MGPGCQNLVFLISAALAGTASASESIEEIFVYGDNEKSIVSEKTMAVSKTKTDILLLPQSVQVLNRAYLDEQDSRSLNEAMVNVSGVSGITPSETLISDYRIRGFNAYLYYDQMPAFGQVPSNSPESMINIERIEVVKGPTSTLFGGGTGAGVGGLINVVTKSPQVEARYQLGLRAGSFDTANPYFDFNQPLSDALGFRVTGNYQRADSQFDEVESESWSLNPALTIRFSERSNLLLKAQFSELEYREYSALPAIGTLEPAAYDIPLDRYPGAADTPLSKVENALLTSQWNYTMSGNTGFNVSVRLYQNKSMEYSSWLAPDLTTTIADTLALFDLGAPFDPTKDSIYVVSNGSLPYDNRQLNINANLAHRLSLGGSVHQLLFGIEVDDTENDAQMFIDDYCNILNATFALLSNPDDPAVRETYFATIAAVPTLDISDGSSRVSFGPEPSVACFGEQDYRYHTLGAYVQDQIALGDRWHLDLGLRWTRLGSVESLAAEMAGDDRETENDKLIGRFGATYRASEAVSLFAGYGQGFQAPIAIALASGNTPKPSESESWEAGIKWRTTSGFSGNFAYFDLRRTNIATADPSAPGFQVQIGEQQSKGVELDFVWPFAERWKLLGNIANIEAEVTADNTLPIGESLPRIPGSSGRLSLRHEFDGTLTGLALQLGALHRGGREITLPNTWSVDSCTLYDLRASYAWNDYQLRFSVNNLTNEAYFEPHGFLALPVVEPGRERTAYLTLEAAY